jgi:hypothetical protein
MILGIRNALILPAAGLALIAASAPAFAEVYAVSPADGRTWEVRVAPGGPGESLPWTPLGLSASPGLALNPGGDRRGDDAPAIASSDTTGLPMAAWASRIGAGDHDIQVSAFDGTGWYPLPSIRPGGSHDDLQPSLTVVDGLPFVAWTERKPASTIWVSRLTPGGFWTDPVEIAASGTSLSRPIVLAIDSRIVVSSLSRPAGGKGVVKIRQDLFDREIPGDNPRPDGTDGPTPFPPTRGPGGGGPGDGGVGPN